MTMHAIAGDEVVVEGRIVGQPRRRGEVLEAAGEPDHERYRVRWDDGRESILFPGPETHTIHFGEVPRLERRTEAAAPTPAYFQPLRISDPVLRIARYPVETVDARASLKSAAETLAADNIGALIVMATHAQAGVVSERDVTRFVAAGDDLDNVEAADAISTDLVYARPEESIATVARMMLESQIRHMPIIRGRTELVGLVSIRDVLQVYADSASG